LPVFTALEGFVKKTFWMCAAVCGTAIGVHATQFTYSDTGGTVIQGTSLSITGVSLASTAGTVSMSCPLTSITPQYPYYSEWSCIGGSVSFQSTDGSTAFSGSFPSGVFALQKKVTNGYSARPTPARAGWRRGRVVPSR